MSSDGSLLMEHYASIFIDEFFMAFFNSLTHFTHEVGNEKEEILRSLPAYPCREFEKEA